ncbi:MAG: tetratricopeptide repeat protein, partial [Treponema sp.]|nr:tetratricopeptide repeat protein [Treponema sp.]
MTKILMFLFVLTSFLPACGGGTTGEYDRLKNGDLEGEELVAALEDFEVRHPGHFYAKVDLGTYYLARGEEGRARDYLRRAEACAEKAGTPPDGENYPAIMYGALGQICLNRGEYRQALEYAERAIEAAGEAAKDYLVLKSRVLVAQQDYAGALAIFDGLFAADALSTAEDSESGDILAYLFLLAQAERTAEAAALLNRYFETGAFFPSLGSFAAMVYRAAGETERAAYAAYLEQEYRSGYADGADQGPGA